MKYAPASAFVPAKLLLMSRASSRTSASFITARHSLQRRSRAACEPPGPGLSLLHFVGEHGLLDGRQDLVDVLAGRDDDRHQDLLLRLAAFQGDECRLGRADAHEV